MCRLALEALVGELAAEDGLAAAAVAARDVAPLQDLVGVGVGVRVGVGLG